MRASTLHERLERAANSDEGVTFLRGEEASFFPYAELARRARRVAYGLQSAGVQPAEVVGLAVPTGPEFYAAFLGIVCAGAVPASLPLPRRFGDRDAYERERDAMLRACGAHRLVTLRELEALASECDGDELTLSPPSPDSLALVQFSSGTTSEPKAIPLTHRQLLANVDALLERFMTAFPERDGFRHVGVSWLPLYHDMGLVGAMLLSLAHPGPLVLMRPEAFIARPASWLRAISRFGGTVSAAPNFAYDLCVDRIRDEELQDVDLSSWRLALNGSEAVGGTTLERFRGRFAPHGLRREALTPVYGLGEVALGVTFGDPHAEARIVERDGHRFVGCGPPLPGYDVRLEEGRVLIRGPSLMSGYLGDGCRGIRDDGFFDTGDLGFLDGGELFVTGRAKELIIVRGRNIAPGVLEEALRGVCGVEATCAVSVPGRNGERLVVLAECASGSTPPDAGDAKALAERINARLSQTVGLVADGVVALRPGALPRTTSGKLRRLEAAQRFGAG